MCASPAVSSAARLLQDLSEQFASYFTRVFGLECQSAVLLAEKLVAILCDCWKGADIYISPSQRFRFEGRVLVIFYAEGAEGHTRAPISSRHAVRREELLKDLAERFISLLLKEFSPNIGTAIAATSQLMGLLCERWKGQGVYVPAGIRSQNIEPDRTLCDNAQTTNTGDHVTGREMRAGRTKKNAIRRSEVLQDIGDRFTHLLLKEFGLEQQSAAATAEQLVELLRQCWEGQNFYFPIGTHFAYEGEELTVSFKEERRYGNTSSTVRRQALCRELYARFIDFLARDFCATRELAIPIAQRLMAIIPESWKSQSLYISREIRHRNVSRDWEIYKRAQRGNAGDLALEYGLSFVRIHQIISSCAAEIQARARASAPQRAAATFLPGRPDTDHVPLAESINHANRKSFITD